MILTCPSCASRFEVDRAHLGDQGRKVRCGRCEHVWHQAPPDVPAPPAEPEADPGEPPEEDAGLDQAAGLAALETDQEPDRIAAPFSKLQEFDEVRRQASEAEDSRQPRSWRAIALPWLLFAVVVAIIGAGLVLGRDQITTAIPEAAKLYEMVGFEVAQPDPGEGLELRDVKQVRSLENGEYTLVIHGKVENVSDVPREVPGVRVTITDESDQLVDSWMIEPESALLAPGESTDFQTSIKDPPRNGNLAVDIHKPES